MNIHENASMTPRGRARLVREIDRIGLKIAARASRLPRCSDASKVERTVALRRNQRLTYARIAERVVLSASVVAHAFATARPGMAWWTATQAAQLLGVQRGRTQTSEQTNQHRAPSNRLAIHPGAV